MALGTSRFARVSKEDIGFFAPAVNTSGLQYLEQKTDEDIIIETGVDFRGQLLSTGETATKTEGRIKSGLKRISYNVKWNAYTFFERLARIRLANMTMYADKPRQVPVEGMDEEDGDGTMMPLSGGYGLFIMKPEYYKGHYNVIPVMDSLVGETTDETKNKYLQILQLLINMKSKDGSPLYDQALLIEAGRGIIDDVIDLDKISEKRASEKTGEQMLNEFESAEGINPTGAGSPDSGVIPKEQQSGRPIILPSQAS